MTPGPSDIVGPLVRLTDRSLVLVDSDVDGRFRMLETIRHYAWTRLVEAGEAERLEQAHAEDMVAVAEAAEPELRGPARPRWLQWLGRETDNLRAAQRWCLTHAESCPDLGLRLLAALGWFSYFACRPSAGPEIDAMLTAAVAGSADVRARALQARSLAARPGGCVVHPSAACAQAARDSLAVFDGAGSVHRAAYSRTLLAVQGVAGTDVAEAESLLARAVADFTRLDDRWGQALAAFVRMEMQYCSGDAADADRNGELAASMFRELVDHSGAAAVLFHRGMALHFGGRLREAQPVYEAALTEGRRGGAANTIQYTLAHLGHVRLLLDDPAQAAARFAEAHAVARSVGAGGNPSAGLGEALLARREGDLDGAGYHYRDVLCMLDGSEEPLWWALALARAGLGFVAELHADPDTAVRHHRAAWEIASRTPGVEGVGAVALEGLACVAAGHDQAGTAARLLGAATAWRERHRLPATLIEAHDIERAAQRARDVLGSPAFGRALAEGRRTRPPVD